MAFKKITYTQFDVLGHDQVNKIQDALVELENSKPYTAFTRENEPQERPKNCLYGLILVDYREVN